MTQLVGVSREEPFPEEPELIEKLKRVNPRGLLRETPVSDLITPCRDWIEEWFGQKEMMAKQVWRLFRERTELPVSYWTMKRYLRTHFQFGVPVVTIRMEVEPGSQAQVDLGYVGMMVDPVTGKLRRSWAFIITISFSRHRFVRFIFRPDVCNWIDCHIRAFEFFWGVPTSVVLDNLKAGVIKADLYDPMLNRAYGELERYYEFVADPAKAGKPRHKGKMDRGVPVVRKNLLAGRTFRDIDEANERGLRWCR
jgi:transposase